MTNRMSLDFSETHWRYAEATEAIDHIQLKKNYDLFIAGKWVPVQTGKSYQSINPATEEIIATVGEAGVKDVDQAVQSAREAYEKYWSKLSGKDRGKYIYRIARMIQEKAREFAVIETMDGGKPIRETKLVDIPLAAAHFFYYAGWADKLELAHPGKIVRPYGVAAQIIPWNFPLLMAAWKIAPALATGNTVVLKPAETTPLTALKLAEILEEIDLPPGVVNIVTGGPETGKHLIRHQGIDKIAFTGSTEVGKIILETANQKQIPVTLELGGKAANIVMEDAPVDQAVEGIVNGIYFNQGHVCCAGSRLLVQESIAEEILLKLKDRMKTLRVGNPLDKNTDIGAINSFTQWNTIDRYINIGIEEGASLFQVKCDLPSKGYWCPPSLFTEVAQSHRIVQEEIFGPVLTLQTFRTVEEAITIANNTPYGLSAGVWTDKGSKIFKLTQAMRAGVVWANTYNRFDPASPFGGYKESGFGREGGWHGLQAYLKTDN